MTYYKAPNTVEGAIGRVLGVLSPLDIQDAASLSPDALYKAGNPNNPRQLPMKAAAGLDGALVARGMAPAFLPIYQDLMSETVQRLGNVSVPPMDLNMGFRRLAKELGDLAAALDGMDGNATAETYRDIAHEAQDVAEWARTMVKAAEQLARQPQPRPGRPRVVTAAE